MPRPMPSKNSETRVGDNSSKLGTNSQRPIWKLLPQKLPPQDCFICFAVLLVMVNFGNLLWRRRSEGCLGGWAKSGISKKSRIGFVCVARGRKYEWKRCVYPDCLIPSWPLWRKHQLEGFILPTSESSVSLVSLMLSLGSALPRFLSALASVFSSTGVSS